MDRHGPGGATELVRRISLSLPEAAEKEAWGDATFRVREKIFAMVKTGDGRVSAWAKAPAGSRQILVGADPENFFVPPYLGHRGWIGVRLDGTVGRDEIAAIVLRSYRLVAPRRLAAMTEDWKDR